MYSLNNYKNFFREHLLFVGVLFIGLYLANFLYWIQDDAYISLVYARHLAEGQGLTWNGERVQGFSNPLWVFLGAFGFLINIELHTYLKIIQLLIFAGVLSAIYYLSLLLFEKVTYALIPVTLQIINFTTLKYATGGLETNLLCLFFLMLAIFAIKFKNTEKICYVIAFSIVCFLSAITHPTSGLFVLVLSLVVIAIGIQKNQLKKVAFGFLPGLLLSIIWLLFVHSYFGSIFPNTYFAKMSTTVHHEVGLQQIWLFLSNYGYHWAFLLTFFGVLFQKIPSWVFIVTLLILVWFGVIISIGGDFMEFRVLVPTVPFLHILLTFMIIRLAVLKYIRLPILTVFVLTFLSYFSWSYASDEKKFGSNKTIDSILMLETFYFVYPDGDFSTVGEAVKTFFAPHNPTLSVTGAGAIPFYSQLPAIDSWGLNDKWVAKHGVEMPDSYKRPGHRKRAPMRYLVEKKVDIVLEHPLIIGNENLYVYRGSIMQWLYEIPGYLRWKETNETILVKIPLDKNRNLLVLLLNKNLLDPNRMKWFKVG